MQFDVSGQILTRRTVIALKALSITFRSLQKPSNARDMPSLIHPKREDVSSGLDLLFFNALFYDIRFLWLICGSNTAVCTLSIAITSLSFYTAVHQDRRVRTDAKFIVSQNSFSTRNIVATSAFDSLFDSKGKCLECRFRSVVIVFAP